MYGHCKTPDDVLRLITEHNIQIVDLRFTDLPGMWQHASIPASQLTAKSFERGIGFDGSSIRGFQAIQESDMLLMPDPTTAFIDPFLSVPTLAIICNVYDPETRTPYSRDPRYVAQKAEHFLKSSGIADTSYWGPEAEFFIFDHLAYSVLPHSMGYAIDSREGYWNTGKNGSEPNLAYKIRPKEGYFPAPPSDTFQDIRSEAVLVLEQIGIPVEMHHHEVATAGQGEIDLERDTLTAMADKVMIYKYVIKNIARKHGCVATFMPKPLFGDNGNGMHTHQSLWRGGKNLFYGDGYAELSEDALHYIAGLLTHADALLGLTSPTTNSYKRLVPHYEAPVNIAFSKRNRSACIRIPMYATGPENAASKRIEFRPPDPSCNPYLAFAAMLMAGLDGIRRELDPSPFGPLDINTYDLPPDFCGRVKSVPGSLEAVLDALERDHEWLLEGDVFTTDLITTWLSYKREKELQEVSIRPHPYEFYLYADI